MTVFLALVLIFPPALYIGVWLVVTSILLGWPMTICPGPMPRSAMTSL